MSRYAPILPDSQPADIFLEVRRVSDADRIAARQHSADPYGLGAGWYHLSVPSSADLPGLEPSGHIGGKWHTTFVKLRPQVEDALRQAIFWPPAGLSIIKRLDSGRHWLTATGANHIGGCAVCFMDPPAPAQEGQA